MASKEEETESKRDKKRERERRIVRKRDGCSDGDRSSDINKIWVEKKELCHKSFSFPPLQELINHPFSDLCYVPSQDTRSGLEFSRDQIWVSN